MSSDKIKVCLIEDDEDVIEAVQLALEDQPDIELIVEKVTLNQNQDELLGRIYFGAFHVLLVDLGLPGVHPLGMRWQVGLDLLNKINALSCSAIPIVLTAYDQDANYVEAARNGALNLIAKKGDETFRLLILYIRSGYAYWLAKEDRLRRERLRMGAEVSHDLANLFSFIQGIQLNLLPCIQTDDAETRDGIARFIRIVDNVTNHFRMLSELLNERDHEYAFSKDVDIGQMIDDIHFMWKWQLPSWKINMMVLREGTLSADCCRAWLFAAMLNMCKNAKEAMKNGGDLTVKIAEDNEPGLLRITVSDTGCGMDPKEIEAFAEGRLASSKKGGFGLGNQSIARCIKIHKSPPLIVESQKGVGTTIHIRIPINQTSASFNK